MLTLGLIIAALGIGLLLGLPMALGQIYGSKPVRYIIEVYVWFFRGLPLLVLLFLFYFGVFPALGLDIPAFIIAIVVLGLRGAAYQSQIFRGAILSISEGQMTAALSLGMTPWMAIRTVILPAGAAHLRCPAGRTSTRTDPHRYCGLLCHRRDGTFDPDLADRQPDLSHHARSISRAPVCIIVLNYAGMKCLNKLEEQM